MKSIALLRFISLRVILLSHFIIFSILVVSATQFSLFQYSEHTDLILASLSNLQTSIS
jgi:hypothetical protein